MIPRAHEWGISYIRSGLVCIPKGYADVGNFRSGRDPILPHPTRKTKRERGFNSQEVLTSLMKFMKDF